MTKERDELAKELERVLTANGGSSAVIPKPLGQGILAALRTTPSKDTGAVVRLANELRERSRFPSGVARISEAKAREIAESALSADRASPPPGNREAVLEQLAQHRNWELSYEHGDEEPGTWQVHAVNGGLNDREWTLIGQGETPAIALSRALKTTPNTTTADHGGEVASELNDIDEFIEKWSDCGNLGWCEREGKCTRHNYDEALRALRALRTRHDTEGAGQ